MARPKKHLILFIVEGPSDKAALERPIQALLDGNALGLTAEFLFLETDVTSDSRNNPNNIVGNINKFYIMDYFKGNPYYYPKDVYAVVQICDLDGTFIPEENCRQFTELIYEEKGFYYDPPLIYGSTEEAVIDRNQRKAANIRHLLEQGTIKVKTKSVPYSLYFFSSNIDHFLHGELNLPMREKISRAEGFADRFTEDPVSFVDFMHHHPCAINGKTHAESWAFIMEGCNSLDCHTNFNLFLDSLYTQIKEAEAQENQGDPDPEV